ncbi:MULTISPECIES: class I SAM-dependent methyltransferase [unclassified Streptomyces]|uniref:class I SAM-dependent methyltransferase n=1 Tax=unclassified Streptomyces TaxID=2593676 RepID=UPI0006AED398|nr:MULTISPECIES: methyltransferase domain-containing protein [unclassified Streptomyces]
MIFAPAPVQALPDWDLLYRQGALSQPISDGELFRFRDRTDAAPGQTVVDVGTGLGTLACRTAQLGLRVTGYDSSPAAIERAHQHHAEHSTARFELHDFDADAIPPRLIPGSVDIVTCRHVLQFLDAPRFLTDVRRWLRRNGVLHVTTAVAEKLPAGSKAHALPEAAVQGLAQGWASYDRYDLDPGGMVTAVTLRGPYG